MNLVAYKAFTEKLINNLKADYRVIGLIALGSMADKSHAPDEWSDHDFFVITEGGYQEQIRQHLNWLPDFDQIAYWHRETAHGIKVLYQDGHLLEFAVFDLDELKLARVNDYEILYGEPSVQRGLAAIHVTAQTYHDDRYYFGQLVGNIQVGLSRYARGEKISAHQFIKSYALANTLILAGRYVDAPNKERLDNLDPFRRVEQVYPDFAAEINAMLLKDIPAAARDLLDITERCLASRVEQFPTAAFEVIREYITRIS